MSRKWNGKSLVDDFSALLGDTSTVFKARVLGWLNDGAFDIGTRHDWGFHLVKGKKLLVANEEINTLEVAPPDAPDVVVETGGELSAGSKYKVLLTFTHVNGVETQAGEESEEISCDSTDKSIRISNIPTSIETLATGVNVYLSKDSGAFYLHTRLIDNYTTTLIIEADSDSTVEPPDYESIRRLRGAPFFEGTPSNYLTFKDPDQLRSLIQGQWTSGNPEFFYPNSHNQITLYPLPASEFDLSFYYYRNPIKIYNSIDSQPDLPINFMPVLKAYVIAAGYEYRDRAGQEMKWQKYEQLLDAAINGGTKVSNIEFSVKDVYGDINGIEVG